MKSCFSLFCNFPALSTLKSCFKLMVVQLQEKIIAVQTGSSCTWLVKVGGQRMVSEWILKEDFSCRQRATFGTERAAPRIIVCSYFGVEIDARKAWRGNSRSSCTACNCMFLMSALQQLHDYAMI